ncbi:MAG: type I DNA topoisomerase [Deltaproteobacteria bacterium]|nr:type I DNA topoisomerase [Deltaproteobacteria bacterium]
MSKPLIVVESPTKIRTIKKYIGKNYNVAATVGHIMDLPRKEIGVDIDNDFEPKYTTIAGKAKVIKSLKQAAGNATEIYLAPDPDREGEAIAFHAAEVLKKKGRKFHRVLFHELTQKAIIAALASNEELDINKYEAQQTRRILDRIVGYMISPLLWRKIKGGLSAGRVQSVAVRIICERERAIQAFEPEEYWTITAGLASDLPPEFDARLVKKDNKKLKISDGKTSSAIVAEIKDEKFIVDAVKKKTTKRNPPPPFITSKLQQEAIRKLKFSAKKTMTIAQQLYEGIELGPGEPVGLITYMRTDSTRIAQESAEEAGQLIRKRFGDEYKLDKPRFFKNRKKVQDAHEAIRPASVFHTPEEIGRFLNKDQIALYRLIWKRFVASQMQQALIDQNSVSIKVGRYTFTASGSSIKFPGFLALYQTVDDEIASQKEKKMLPEMTKGMILDLKRLEPKQHFTLPPPRFSEASLVKELEENGIGRPSTYTAIISTIRGKEYVDLVKGYFRPSELGFIVNDLLVQSFPNIMSVDFTARLENRLDSIETDEMKALKVLTLFYDPFKKDINAAAEGMLSMRGVGITTEHDCPECGKKLHIKMGKNGHYLACIGYPECRYTTNYTRDEKGGIQPAEQIKDEVSDEVCKKCGKPMVIKNGKYGPFLACSGYPDCKNTISINSGGPQQETGINCPQKDCQGTIVTKKTRRGKIFYGCNQYPDCKFALWDKPAPQKCPECGAEFMVEKSTKKEGNFLLCMNQECRHKIIKEKE